MLDRRGFLGSILAFVIAGERRWLVAGRNEAMFGLIGSVEAHPGKRDELTAILLDGTRSLPGCLSYIVAADTGDDHVVWVTEVWENQAAHAASLALPGVRAAIARARPLIAGFGQRTLTRPLGGYPIERSSDSGAAPRDLVAQVDDRIVIISAVVPLSALDAYRHFTEPALLQRWLASGAEVEARVGGRYELFWQPEDPENNSTIGCRITALAPGQMISFQWRSPVQFKGFANGADPLTHVVVSFHEEETGTRVHLTHSGWQSDASWEEARAWQERAWRVAFQALERVAAEEM